MHKTRNWILFIVTLLILSGAAWFYFSRDESSKPAYRTGLVERGTIQNEVTATGSLSALTTIQVGTQVSGTISRLFADFNSQVKAGQVIALLDTTFLAAAVEDALAALQKAQVAVDQCRREYDRSSGLYEQQVVPSVEYEQKLFEYETAKSNLRAASAQLTRSRINLRYATIRAPISDVVISRKVDVGQTVAASFNTPTLFTIANDLTKMQVQATVDEADIGQVKLDQEVTFTVDAYPSDHFSGKVSQIRLEPVTIQNVVNYIVIMEVSNPDMKLMPGMTTNISILVEKHPDILKVPASALKVNMNGEGNNTPQKEGNDKLTGRGTIWILQGDSIIKTDVMTGLSDGSATEVTGAINEGDVVVTGINLKESESAKTSQNPFMPQMRAPSSTTKKK